MSLVTKFASAMVKLQMNTIVKNLYFKLSVNNITPSIFEKFFKKKIKNNIKTDALFLYFPIKEASNIKKINTTNDNKNISATIFLVTKSREDC